MASQAFDATLADESKKAVQSLTILKESFLQVKLAADALMKYLPNDQEALATQGKLLEEATKRLIDKNAYIDAWSKALQDLKADRAVRQEIERASEAGQPLPKLEEIFKAKIEAQLRSKQVNYDNHEFMKKLRSTLKIGQDEDEDEDLQVISSQMDNEQALKCPITTMWFEEPVKSTNCNHVYSKKAIEEMIRKTKRNEATQCPVVGCGKVVRKTDLQPDLEKEALVRRHLRQQQTTQLTQHDDAEIIDE